MIRTAVVLALVATSGASLADGIQGNGGDNRLVGTDDKDNISGGGDIFGKGNRERLFGDAGADDVYGGNGGDRIQGGLSGDELFGQTGNDFVDAIDLQPNDLVDCGEGEFGIAGIDGFFGGSDQIAPNSEALYVGIPISDGTSFPSMGKRGAARTPIFRPSMPAKRPSRPRRPLEADQVGGASYSRPRPCYPAGSIRPPGSARSISSRPSSPNAA